MLSKWVGKNVWPGGPEELRSVERVRKIDEVTNERTKISLLELKKVEKTLTDTRECASEN